MAPASFRESMQLAIVQAATEEVPAEGERVSKLEEIQAAKKLAEISPEKRQRTMGGIINIQNTSQDDGWVSASGVSMADTNRETMKTMV